MPNKNPQVVDLRKIKKSRPQTDKSGKNTEHIKIETKESISKIEWVAPEFIRYKKNKKWFVLPAIIALIIIIIALILKNFLLAIAMTITSLVVYIYAKKNPRKIKFIISGRGVEIDQNTYGFENLQSFWIFYDPPEIKEISLRSKKTFMPYIKIPLGDQDPVKIRRFLLKFLPERKHVESTIDELMRKVRF